MAVWLSWRSPLFPVWLWHVLFDGTLCRCARSQGYKRALARLTTEDSSGWPWREDGQEAGSSW